MGYGRAVRRSHETEGEKGMTDGVPACDCIEQIKTRLKNEHNTEVVHVDYLKLRTSYKSLTAKGEYAKHWRSSDQHFKYCPFCGRAYLGA